MTDTGSALTVADSTAWATACHREPTIRALADASKITRQALRDACVELGLGRSRIYELLSRYRRDPVTTSLMDSPGGFPKGERRLSPDIEQIINDGIEQFYLTRPKPTVGQLVRKIGRLCGEQGLAKPGRKPIAARVATIDRARLVKARDGPKASADLYRPVIKAFEAERALEVVQMDHTLADIMIVDEHLRKPLCRPTLTLAVDIHTRVIPGFYISLEHPSATSVGMAIAHAVPPKNKWLQDRGLELAYPVSGIPETIHLDNAREFHSRALERGCRQHGIQLRYRPIRTPHFGGHIERLIGTMVGEVHLLPGTTFSNIQEKGDYDAEAAACMTLRDFERWFALQVGIYHGTIHSGLGVTPLTAWNDALTSSAASLRLPLDADRLLLDFLPFEMRKIRREGIQLFHTFYWHGALAHMAANCDKKLAVKYSPLNLSAVYLELPDGTHLTVPLRDRRRPAITKFEQDLALRELRERGLRSVDERQLFEMVSEQRRIVMDALERTKSARKHAQRATYALDLGSPLKEAVLPVLPSGDADEDEAKPVEPFLIEERP